MNSNPNPILLRIILLALLLGGSACNRATSPDASAPNSSAPAAPTASPLVGQWRNMEGTWRFEPWGAFWFNGGTTVQTFPGSGVTTSRTKILQGKYEVHGTNLHLILKQHTPDVQESTFQIDGQKLTIDGVVYDKQ